MQTTDIDKKIEKLLERPPTFEKFNLLGDLYLQKDNREAATECFYKAAGYARRDKAIAVYKKILKITPEDTRPYHELISIYSDLGLIAEEKKYLLLLARVCHVKGDSDGETAALKKVSELDPSDQSARAFLSRGEVPAEVETEFRKQVEGMEPSPLASIIEESIRAGQQEDTEEIRPRPERKLGLPVFIVAGLVIIAAGFFFLSSGKKGEHTSEIKPSAGTPSLGEPRSLKAVRDGNLQIEVVMLPAGAGGNSYISSLLDQKTAGEYFFCSVTVRATDGCIAEKIFQEIPVSFVLLASDGRALQKKDIPQLRTADKVIYKSNICGAEKGIVYFQFYQAYAKGDMPSGFSHAGKSFMN